MTGHHLIAALYLAGVVALIVVPLGVAGMLNQRRRDRRGGYILPPSTEALAAKTDEAAPDPRDDWGFPLHWHEGQRDVRREMGDAA